MPDLILCLCSFHFFRLLIHSLTYPYSPFVGQEIAILRLSIPSAPAPTLSHSGDNEQTSYDDPCNLEVFLELYLC